MLLIYSHKLKTKCSDVKVPYNIHGLVEVKNCTSDIHTFRLEIQQNLNFFRISQSESVKYLYYMLHKIIYVKE